MEEKEKMPECCRHKVRSEEEIKSLVSRLNKIEGQIRGIKNMVLDGRYCPDILVQAAAVNAALGSFNRELLESHINTCVVTDIKEGREDTTKELMDIIKKLMK
ncbi:MAG: metal-sensing transcriptional repressor [Lachnospiraceae bacterium]|nr:metal-sensing transcriptional repressor [Lachnospiraceae bacterium]